MDGLHFAVAVEGHDAGAVLHGGLIAGMDVVGDQFREREIFLRGAWKALGLGAGPCYLCKACVLREGPCRHAELARPAMEACGIDVFTTVRSAGWEIEVVQSRDDELRREAEKTFDLLYEAYSDTREVTRA